MDEPLNVQEVVSDVASKFNFIFLLIGLNKLCQHIRPFLSPSQPHWIDDSNGSQKRINISLLVKRINAH